MNTMLLSALLVVANVMGAGMIVPQVIRLHRGRSADGLSGVWVGVGVALNLWWVAYSLQGHLWGLVPVSVAGTILYTTIASQYLALVGRSAYWPLARGFVGIGALPTIALIVGGWSAAGLAIGLSYGLQFSPAALAAVRATRVAGISPTTWTMAWIEAVIWLAYGAAVNDAALVVGGIGGAIMATVILVRLGQLRNPAIEATNYGSAARATDPLRATS